MNAIQGLFYAPQALHDRYTQCLAAGALANDLSAVEQHWLQQAVYDQPSIPAVRACNLFVSRHASRAVLWAGALLLREHDSPESPLFLFTPQGTLERFASEGALRQGLEQRLDDVSQQAQLLHFIPVDVRPLLQKAGELTLRTQAVPAPVMQHVSQGVSDYLARCREETLASLVGAPTLRAVLDAQLRSALEGEFPGLQLDPNSFWVLSRSPAQPPAPAGEVITTTLSSTALDFYCKGLLPAHETREYLGLPVDAPAQALSPQAVEQRLVRAMTRATLNLDAHMRAALDAYWQAAPGARPSPLEYCVARLGDLFYQQALQARHDGLITREQFDRLQRPGFGGDRTAQVQAAQLSVFDPQRGEVPLSGLFCLFSPGRNSPVFSFSGALGLIRHDSRAHLKTWVLSSLRAPSRFALIAPHIAADQHELIIGMTEPRLSVENLAVDAFSGCVQAIRDRQVSDFNFLLSQFRAGKVVVAAVDHALDIRELIDHDLLALNSQRRWSSRFVPGAYDLRLAPEGNGEQPRELSLKLTNIEAQRDELLGHWPTPRSFALTHLSAVLARLGHGQREAASVMLQIFAAQTPPGQSPVRSVSLVDALLERVTGDHPLPDNPALIQAAVHSARSDELKLHKTLGGTKVLTVLDQAASDFTALFKQHLRSFFVTPYSPAGPDALLLRLATLRMAMLRADLRLMHLDSTIASADSAIITHVLVNPVSNLRSALDQFVPDVYGLTLSFNGTVGTLTVVNCLLFTQRGGLESDNAGRAIIWTPAAGYQGFESVDQCTAHLEARLLDPSRRWELLAHVNAAQQARVSDYLDGSEGWKAAGQNRWFYFERFEQDFTVQAQTAAIDKVLADADFICHVARVTPWSAQALENSAQSLLIQSHAGVTLERLKETARLQAFNNALPDWLKKASADDRQHYARLLQRYQRAGQGDQNYLQGVPEISDFARALLTLRLYADFPGLELEPDDIAVVVDTYLPAPVATGEIPSFLPAATTRTQYTLTQFALSGHGQLHPDAVTVHAIGTRPLPLGLTARYVRLRARQLNIGAHYQALLRARLAPGNEGVDVRLQQFAEHLGLQVMEQVFREKLIDPGSETAYRYLQHVIEMPDGQARTPLDGVEVTIRPFELIAEPGSEPDRVSGMYLVGPAAQQAGPQVLWVTYSQQLAFKVYDSDGAVLEQLRNDPDFQDLILPRIDPYARKTYANGGFVEPHLPRSIESPGGELLARPASPTLASRPVAGNLYKQLYSDNYQLLLQMAAAQSKSTAQADWESFKYLMSLLAQTALMFLPARLSIPVVVWQSLGMLRAGVSAVKKGEWGEAVGEFAMALMMTASSAPQAGEPRLAQPLPEPPATRAMPAAVGLTPEQQAGLLPFRANEVALTDLQLDPVTRLYGDPATGLTYVHLGGQVFRLTAWRDRWRIFIGEEREGPLVKLNEHTQWMLDTQEPLLGGGPVLSRSILGTYSFTYEINAVGMDSIQRRLPERALMIREAHALACTYLQRCQSALRTLSDAGTQNASNRDLLEDFFDVVALDQAMLERIRQCIDAMLARLLHPDMSPQTSSKYVVCRSRFTDDTIAFVNIADPGKMMYLTDRFFETMFQQPYALSHPYLKQAASSFAVNQHYRATFLLHEASHIALNTEDILYLNPGFPYGDLLDGQTRFGARLKTFTNHLQVGHSPHIDEDSLFKLFNNATRGWDDIPPGAAKRRLKDIAGVRTLDQARLVFMTNPMKRIEMMLANADTVVLLIIRLGRFFPVLPDAER